MFFLGKKIYALVLAFLFPMISMAETVVISVEPETTRQIGGVSKLDRKTYFSVSDHGADFDRRVTKNIYDYLVDDLGITFGRAFGPVKYMASNLPEDPRRPGYADLSSLRNKNIQISDGEFYKDFGPNLDVVAHGSPNEFPEYMGKYFRGKSEASSNKQWLPRNIDASAELAAAVLKYNYSEFDRPKYYEPINEPYWEFYSDPHLSDWHMKMREMIKDQTSDVEVGGPCLGVSYFFRNNYNSFNGLKSFIDFTDGEMDFYSFHSYDYHKFENGKFNSRIQSGLPLEGSLDLLQNYVIRRTGKEVKVVVSEHGGFMISPESNDYIGDEFANAIVEEKYPDVSGWEKELKKRSVISFLNVNSIIGNTLTFMEHPHTVAKCVPFFFPHTWNWDPKFYASMYVPKNYTDQTQWVPTNMLDFYKLFRGVNGRRVKVSCDDPDLQARAFVDGSKLYFIVNNLSESSESIAINGIKSDKVSIRRFSRLESFEADYSELEIDTPKTLELKGLDTVVLVSDFGAPIQETKLVDEVNFYADKMMLPLNNATFSVKVPVDEKPIDYATIRIGLTRKSDKERTPTVNVNGHLFAPQLEDCAERLSDNEYGTTKFIQIDPKILKENNEIEVRFPDGEEGVVGSVVIRVGFKK